MSAPYKLIHLSLRIYQHTVLNGILQYFAGEVQDWNKMSAEHPLVLKFIFSRSLFKLFSHLNRLYYAFQTRTNTNSDLK